MRNLIEDKDLLLNDLCGRLPYGVKCAYFDGMGNECEDILNAIFPNDERLLVGKCSIDYSESDILGVVPYLFPLSSMTEEQKEEFDRLYTYDALIVEPQWKLIDFCNKHHLDYRGLIPMGIGIDATNLNVY
jgi:hypothetical protein